MNKNIAFVAAALVSFAAGAEIMDRPQGVKIGQRLTLRPYVGISFTYDSNVDSTKDAEANQSFGINPGFDLAYKGDDWDLSGQVYYQYHAYTGGNSENLNNHSYGESLTFNWTGVKNWSARITETVALISQDDDMMNDGGRGCGRDRLQVQVGGALQHRFTDALHGSVNASYYYLNYDNDATSYGPMYGWDRWTAGLEMGYVLTPWTDFLLVGNYQGYTQENSSEIGSSEGWATESKGNRISGNSWGTTVQGGLGTHATERISYRLLAGWSHFEYGGGAASDNGFTYTASGNWKMSDTWTMMLMAGSYYQPSEYHYGSACRNDTVSWGLGHSMVRGKLNATFDIAYRHQTNTHVEYDESDYNDDIITARLGLNYILNRFLSLYGSVEYQKDFRNGDYVETRSMDYDRWRGTIGVRLTY